MPSLFDKLRNSATGNTASNINTSSKKDPKEPPQTWLQKLQHDNQPVREDGGDKFFGVENFGNTCYFNSILQCLYYSVPFRELVLNYPNRSPIHNILNDADGQPRFKQSTHGEQNEQVAPSPSKPKSAATQTSARTAGVPTNPNKPEDKESPEYKKKQAIANGPVLSVDYDNSKTYGMESSLFTSLKDMFEAIIASSSRTGVVSPKHFLKVLQDQNEMFRGAMHQDAHEFLNYLLNAVVDSVEEHTKNLEALGGANGQAANGSGNGVVKAAPKPNLEELNSISREVHGLFKGTLTSETKCLTCENVSQRDEPFLDLSVDLENHCSVTSCLRKFSEEEMLCERDKFFCDKCGGLQEAEKRMKIKRLPKVLALHLKRFKYTEDFMRLQKLFHRVVYPYHLRLFNTTDDAEDPDRLYELYAVVVHIGSGPYHGHYISIIKTPDRGWLLFDDEMVESVDKSFVRNFFGAQIGMACAYVLFYQETTLEAVKAEQEAEGLAAAAAARAAETTASANGKDSHGLGLNIKTNGTAHATTPISPIDDEGAPLSLAHARTAPASAGATPLTATNTSALPTPLLPSHTPLTAHAPSNATSPLLSPLTRKATDSASKKAMAKMEKDRKQAEKAAEKAAKEDQKAAEKQEKARQKSIEQRNKETAKAQAASARHSLKERRRTNGDPLPEEGVLNGTATGPTSAPITNGSAAATATATGGSVAAVQGATSVPAVNTATGEAVNSTSGPTPGPATLSTPTPLSNVSTSTQPTSHTHSSSFSGASNPLNRFRPSSKSISMRKSKIWGLGRDSKDLSRDTSGGKEDVAVYDGDEGDEEGSDKALDRGLDKENIKVDPKGVDKDKEGGKELKEKASVLGMSSGTIKKRGFSLRKKASSLLS